MKRYTWLACLVVATGAVFAPSASAQATGEIPMTFAAGCDAVFNKTPSGLVHEWRSDDPGCGAITTAQGPEDDLRLTFRPTVKLKNGASPTCGEPSLLLYTIIPWANDVAVLEDFLGPLGTLWNVCFYRLSDESSGNVSYTANGLARTFVYDVWEGGAPTREADGGTAHYSDANGAAYDVNVSCVDVDGATTYIGGSVSGASDSSWNGMYLYAKMVDGAPDTISGSFAVTDPCATLGDVDPADGPFEVTGGSLQNRLGSPG